MNPETTLSSLKPGRRAGLAIGVAVLLVSAAFPGDAEAVRRACRATGDYLEYSFQEFVDGSLVGQRVWRVSVQPEDMEAVASTDMPTIYQAKESSCRAAAFCLAQQVAMESYVCEGTSNLKYETVRRPPGIVGWRRSLACDAARAGEVPGLSPGANRVRLVKTKFVAIGHRDEVTRYSDRTVSESDHVCWDGGGVAHFPPGVHFDPEGKPSRPKPPRPASDDLRVPFQVTGGSLEVTPSLHNGSCPTQIEVEASLTVAGQGTVRFRLNHKGGRGPIRSVTFREGGTKASTMTYTIGASGGGGGPTEGMAAQGGSGGGGIGGFQQNTVPNQHTGWFEIEIVSPGSPFKKSELAHYKVICKPTPAMEPVEAQLAPGIGGGGDGSRKDGPAQPSAGAPDLVLLSAAPGRDGACRLVVGNVGKQRSASTVVQLSAQGQKPIDLDLPPTPPGGRHAVPVRDLGAFDWLVHLDRSNAVRESDEDNNRAWIQGCRAIGRR
jgi:hypothetical protein